MNKKIFVSVGYEDWTRFKVSFKGNYAHQIAEQLKNVGGDENE